MTAQAAMMPADAHLADGGVDGTVRMAFAERVKDVGRVDMRHLHQVGLLLVESVLLGTPLASRTEPAVPEPLPEPLEAPRRRRTLSGLISKLLVKEPKNRIKLDDVLKHPWIARFSQ